MKQALLTMLCQWIRRGLSVGREHITSLVNTLALAYSGEHSGRDNSYLGWEYNVSFRRTPYYRAHGLRLGPLATAGCLKLQL